MANETTYLLHEKLLAWQVACALLNAVREARISDSKLRDQAMRAAQSACLNIAEANGRVSLADRRRVFAIARGEATEAAAAVQVAALSGSCEPNSAEIARRHGARVAALLTGLIGKGRMQAK
jgi:four helix bundle protein